MSKKEKASDMNSGGSFGARRTDTEIEAELIAKFGNGPLTDEEQRDWNQHVADMKIEQAALERPADFRVGTFSILTRPTVH